MLFERKREDSLGLRRRHREFSRSRFEVQLWIPSSLFFCSLRSTAQGSVSFVKLIICFDISFVSCGASNLWKRFVLCLVDKKVCEKKIKLEC